MGSDRRESQGEGRGLCAGRAAVAVERRGGAVVPSEAYYVLNPGGDLRRTQETFHERFATPPWEGVAGEPPKEVELRAALERKDLFVYCGHGDGSRYVSADALRQLERCPVSFLMGCSSGALRTHGALAPSGMALSYLHARCPALVANLWDVTDGEIDRFCEALIEGCGGGGGGGGGGDGGGGSEKSQSGVCLLSVVSRARAACRLRYLTGAAAVCYGVPVLIKVP